ncbi:hypothetical protein LCGC14_0428750 [marine sediment metagenome]|uniref:Uncharacterized protein n=1 Tax=marine sediment metagenome TaxID=412755 RepID=A0A0F9T6Q2_9ZZZZ
MSLSKKLRKTVRPKPQLKTRPEILLCPNIPSPMHGVTPRSILGPKWWNETRKAAYKSTAYRCLACGIYKFSAAFRQWLEGHELYKVDYKLGRLTYIETVPLCFCCHNYIHDGRLRAMLEHHEITDCRFVAIIQHGDRVLSAAGLSRLSFAERRDELIEAGLQGEVAGWKKWRMVLKGKMYKPKFATPQQWEKAFLKRR